MPSKILKFSKDRLITGINIVDGMLFFTDNHTEPKKINIEKFKGNNPEVAIDHSTGTTSIYGRPFVEADITVIKGHPKHALDTDLTRDSQVSDDGGDIIDLDPSPTPSTFTIKTVLPRGVSLNKIDVKGQIIFGNKNVIEHGFYYTFSESFGDRADLSDIDGLIANVGNGSVFKINRDNPPAGIYDFTIDTPTAITQGAVAGGYISYLAYCIVEGEAGQSNEYYFAPTKRSYKLTDQTQTPTGSIDNLELSILRRTSSVYFSGGSMTASFTNTSNLNAKDLPKGFFVSKAYREIDNPATPSYSDIEDQTTERDPSSSDLFPEAFVGAEEVADDFLNENKFYLKDGIDFGRLNTGDVYFAFAFIETSPNNYLRSPIEKLVVGSSDGSSEPPQIRHINTNVQATTIDFTGNVNKAGTDATLTERGYIFSTDVDDLNVIKRIFNDFNTSSPYEYNGLEPISNTFKVPAAIPAGKTGEEISGDGSGDFTVSTDNYLTNLTEGTTVHYIAYAVNSRNQLKFTDTNQFVLDGEYYLLNEGGMFSATTKTNNIPKITAGIGQNYFQNHYNPNRTELFFKFKVHGGIADPTKVSSMGIQYAYATGRDLTYGVTYDNLVKFADEGEYEKIENAPTNGNIDVSQFDYTGEDADEIIGNFVIKDGGVVLRDDVFSSSEDYAIVEEIKAARGDDYGAAVAYTFNGPSLRTLSYFAYIIYDGVTYKSNISSGWWYKYNFVGDLIPASPRFCGSLRFHAPSLFSGGRDANKKVLPEKPSPNGTAQIFGAICPNAPHGDTVGGSMSELGFYWSYTPIPDTTDATTANIVQWANLSTTNKVSATSGSATGPNVTDPTNPVNTVTTAKSWHVNRDNDERGHFEFSATIGPFSSSATKVYWAPYLVPQPRREIQMIPALQETAPSIVFGVTNDLLNSFDVGSPLTAIDVDPTVVIDSINASTTGILSFSGRAEPGSGNYDITRKGFYIKPISAFSTPNNAASVKTEMASPTSRVTLDTNIFNPGSPYAKSSSFAAGTYIASAFCTVVLPDANGVDQTHIRISDNNRQITLDSPPAADEDVTPVVNNIGEGDVMIGQVADAKGVPLTSKGFYVLEVKGAFHNNPNLSKPSNGSALKTIFDNPPANVTAINVPASSADGPGSLRFRDAIPNQKEGYVYYYAAYAANSSKEGISGSVKFQEYLEEFEKFIEISPIPFNNTIKCNNRGQVKINQLEAFFDNNISIKVKTELASLDNFNFSLSNWSSGGRITSVNKRTSPNGNFIDINLVGTNYSPFPRECHLRIYHATDMSKFIILSIIQDGNSDTGDEFIEPIDLKYNKETDEDNLDIGTLL